MINSTFSNAHIPDAEMHDPSSKNYSGHDMSAIRTDVLSQVLTLIRLRGELVYAARLSGSWGITFPKGGAHFYFVDKGALWVATAGAAPIHVKQGDLLLLPHGGGHTIRDHPASPCVPLGDIVGGHFDRGASTLVYGGEGPACLLVGGLFHFEGASLAAVMASLPTMVHIARDGAHAPDWLDSITSFLLQESRGAEPGAALMISRLIDLLVIRTLRTWAGALRQPSSWLGGLADERIGKALNAIHADPYRPWRVRDLAAISAMSRSMFAERFSAGVGEAPLHYVKRWKLTLAADILAGGGVKVTQVAQRTGYHSDAGFSRAFKSQFGYAPSEAQRREDLKRDKRS